jgi:hypothetical protein
MFEQLFSGLKSGLSSVGAGLSSFLQGAGQGLGITNPTIQPSMMPTAQVAQPTGQNKFLSLINDLAKQYSQNSREQDIYNVMPASEGAQIINSQRAVQMRQDEVNRQNAQQQAIRDALANPASDSALARLEQIAAITGDPSAMERYLVASGKGGSSPALIQIADAIMETYPPEQRTPDLYRQTIETAGKFYDKGIFSGGMGTGGGYVPPVGGTPGIAAPIGQPMPQGFPTGGPVLLEPPLLDGVERPAAAPMPAAPTGGQAGFGLSPTYADAIASLEAKKAAARKQAEANVELGTAPAIKAATEAATIAAKSGAERDAESVKKAKDAEIIISLADEAEKLLPQATSGKLSQATTEAAKFFGKSTDASKADARLKIIAGQLVGNIPRFEGPQSDADTRLYREMAGDVANTELPFEDRQAALKTIKQLQQRYLPENKADDAKLKRLEELRKLAAQRNGGQ